MKVEVTGRVLGNARVDRLDLLAEPRDVQIDGACESHGCLLEAEGCGAGLDELVHRARTRDDSALDQVLLRVAARLDARRARPQCAATLEEVFHHGRKRLERVSATEDSS